MTGLTPMENQTLNVLLVEDNLADAKILTSFLEEGSTGLNIHLVKDGEEATKYLLRQGEHAAVAPPDVVLLDINLPKKNGFEVLAEMRQDARSSGIPVFVISSSRNPEDLVRGQALNVAGFYKKPSEITGFEKLVSDLVTVEFPRHIPSKFLKDSRDAALRIEREAAEKARRIQPGQELFKQLVDAIRDYAIYMVDQSGHILTWNEGAERIMGYRAIEVIGKHLSIFTPEELLARHQPAVELEIAAREGRFQEEGWRVRKGGARFWASVTLTAIRNPSGELVGFGQVTRDYSERREAEKNLAESERRFRLLVDEVKEYAIFMLTPEGNIASWNLGAERIKGYKAAEIIGRHFSIFYSKDALESGHPEKELEIARVKGVYEEEGLRIRKDGSTFWANVVITALYDQDAKLQGFSKVTRDITERKRVEQETKQWAADLEKQMAERTVQLEVSRVEISKQRGLLSRFNSDLQQFAYVASHDLQEPLRTVVSCLQLVDKRFGMELPPDAREYMSLAVAGSQRMRALVEGLLSFGRVGQLVQSERLVDLNRVLHDALDAMRAPLEASGATVVVTSLPFIAVDPGRMAQLFQHLIDNAIKFRKPDEPLRIAIGSQKIGDEWIFTVEDNGIGIARQYFERIFVIFQRLQGERDKIPGTGIGLTLCKRIVEAHGGRMWVESEPGVGSAFRFSLPA